ncbi:MAG: alkane 1-monooxygenase, partial [Flavobacteriaceae bacterium]
MKDLKYLFAYTVPLAAFISFTSTGVGTYAAVIYAFVVLPILDMVLGKNETNLGDIERNNKAINT